MDERYEIVESELELSSVGLNCNCLIPLLRIESACCASSCWKFKESSVDLRKGIWTDINGISGDRLMNAAVNSIIY